MLKRILLAIIVILLCMTITMAFGITNISYAGTTTNPNFDLGNYENGDGGAATNSVRNISGGVLNIIRIACVGIALIMLTVLGMKYMLASPNDRAEIKGSAIRYILGAMIMFGASGILSIIDSFTRSTVPNAT